MTFFARSASYLMAMGVGGFLGFLALHSPTNPQPNVSTISIGSTANAEEVIRDPLNSLKTCEPEVHAPMIGTSSKPSETERTPIRILVIGGHPADVFDQSGGTMAHHVERGDWVGCAVMTTGVRTHDKVISNDMQNSKSVPEAEKLNTLIAERAKVKEREVIEACGILGVRESDIHFIGADDAALLVDRELIRKVARLIRTLKPDVILTHWPEEDGGYGTAHAITGQMVLHAIPLAAGVDPGDTTPPHKVTQVFFFGQGSAAARSGLWGSVGGFTNDVFVDITDVAERKVRCFDAMKSQGYDGDYARKRIETSDGAFGSRIRRAYAEGFISLNSTSNYYLPVSEMDLESARKSDHQTMQRRTFRVNVP